MPSFNPDSVADFPPNIYLVCDALREEIEILRDHGLIVGRVEYVDSRLHMQPERLGEVLEAKVDDCRRRGSDVYLIFGDCAPTMFDLTRRPGVRRTDCANCIELLLGKERYREFLQQGAFFLTRQWTSRWNEIFSSSPGYSFEMIVDMIRREHTKLVYLDAGIHPLPVETLDEISSATGLPWISAKITFRPLIKSIGRMAEVPQLAEVSP